MRRERLDEWERKRWTGRERKRKGGSDIAEMGVGIW